MGNIKTEARLLFKYIVRNANTPNMAKRPAWMPSKPFAVVDKPYEKDYMIFQKELQLSENREFWNGIEIIFKDTEGKIKCKGIIECTGTVYDDSTDSYKHTATVIIEQDIILSADSEDAAKNAVDTFVAEVFTAKGWTKLDNLTLNDLKPHLDEHNEPTQVVGNDTSI